MVKKLIKHEFLYYVRTVGIALPLILAIAVMFRIFYTLNGLTDGSVVTTIATASSGLMLYIAAIAILLYSTVISVVRFYKNLFTAEGYLTFTLPVTNEQHIFVKLMMSAASTLACMLTVSAAVAIALAGDLFNDLFGSLLYTLGHMFEAIPTAHTVLYAVEIFILLAIGIVSAPLLYYACIAVGQTAKKNRILMAVGAYFVYYMISQAVATIFMIIFVVLGSLGALDGIAALFEKAPYLFVHVIFILSIVVNAALAWLFYMITLRIMNKKLNLE